MFNTATHKTGDPTFNIEVSHTFSTVATVLTGLLLDSIVSMHD